MIETDLEKDIIRYLEDYIYFLKFQKRKRNDVFKEYANKKIEEVNKCKELLITKNNT